METHGVWHPPTVRTRAFSDAVCLPRRGRVEQPRILLAATLRSPLAARLAIAFHRLGSPVQAWCPDGHPLEKTRAVERIYSCGVLAQQQSLHAAIDAAVPDFIIPCDDAAALHLNQLHGHSGPPDAALAGIVESAVAVSAHAPGTVALRRVIARSLGAPASCALASCRGELMRVALSEAVRIPDSATLCSAADLETWAARSGFPAVLKMDGSWDGLGVVVVHDIEQARRALWNATHPSLLGALSSLIQRRDPAQVRCRLSGTRPAMTVQKFISGQTASRTVACWQGEVLAGSSVLALQTESPTGPATVVQVTRNEEMTETSRRLVRALGLSGICGLDFVIEKSSGAAYLIEVNPHATPVSHLALGEGQDLPAALHAHLRGEPVPMRTSAIRGEVIALFPGESRRNLQSPYLRTAFHDVPWAEMELVRDCVGLPWEQRGIAARITAHLNPHPRPARCAFPLPGMRSVPVSSPEPH